MITVTFISHYFKIELNIRLSQTKYDVLMNNKFYYPMELYRIDVDRVKHGFQPHIFSPAQINKLKNYLSGSEYWDKIM